LRFGVSTAVGVSLVSENCDDSVADLPRAHAGAAPDSQLKAANGSALRHGLHAADHTRESGLRRGAAREIR